MAKFYNDSGLSDKELIATMVSHGYYRKDGDIWFGFFEQDSINFKNLPDQLNPIDDYNGERLFEDSDGNLYSFLDHTWNKDKHRKDIDDYVLANGYGKLYRVQPVKWQIFEEEDGVAFIVADRGLVAHIYDKKNVPYSESSVRKFLNERFLTMVFSKEEQDRILFTQLDNGAKKLEGYEFLGGENTCDKIFLLDYEQATYLNYQYDFDTNTFFLDKKKSTPSSNSSVCRSKTASEYCFAGGAREEDCEDDWEKKCMWMLRSSTPTEYGSMLISGVGPNGSMYHHCSCDFVCALVPALRIRL